MHLIAVYLSGDSDFADVLDVDDTCVGYERCGGCDNCRLAQAAHGGASGADWYGPVYRPKLRSVCTEKP